MDQRPQVVRDIVLTCVVLHNMLRTHLSGLARAPHPQDEVAAIVSEPVVCWAVENWRNPSREAKQQRDLLNDYFNHISALAGQEERIGRCEKDLPLEQKKLVSVSPFQDHNVLCTLIKQTSIMFPNKLKS